MKSRAALQRVTALVSCLAMMATVCWGQLIPGTIDTGVAGLFTFTVFGERAGDQIRILGTGDFNHDGLSDLLVGTRFADPEARRDAGAAYIVFGSSQLIRGDVRDLDSLEGPREHVTLWGAEETDSFGVSAAVGDINGDGIDDFLIGAPRADGPGNSRTSRAGDAGEVYVFFGGPHLTGGTVRDVAGVAGSGPDITIFGQEAPDGLGASIALGDVNADGRTDIILGALGAFGPSNFRAAAGDVFVIFGGPRLTSGAVIDLADRFNGADLVIHGARPVDYLGFATAVGDLNGDGIDDIVMSAPLADGPVNQRVDSGEVYVIFGGARLAATPERDLAGVFAPGADLIIFGQEAGDLIGSSLAIGDFNDDGIKDLAIGALGGGGPDNGRPTAGEAYIIFGDPRLGRESVRDIAGHFGRPAEVMLFGAAYSDQFGRSLSAGDVNQDGITDLLVGAPEADLPNNERSDGGAVYVIFGGWNLFDGLRRDMAGEVGRPADLTLIGPQAGVNFGATLAVANITRHEAKDVIIGAPLAGGRENSRPKAGGVFVLSGK